MPENICLAARFASLELAGQAYDPIQEILRVEEFSNLSVFRIELHGVAHVAVVGEDAGAHIMEVVNQALSLGEMVTLDDEAIGWLRARREGRPQQEGFSEAHYTRETGPRPSREPRRQRRRVSTLRVTWQDVLPTAEDASGVVTDIQTGALVDISPPHYVGVCDWCTVELAPPVAAIYGFTVELEFPDGPTAVTTGKWATCQMCQGRLRIKPGDSQVSFDLVDRLWRLQGSRYLGEGARRLRIRTFYAEGREEE